MTIESLGALYLAGALWAHKDDTRSIWRLPFSGEPGPTGGLTLKRPKTGTPPFSAQVYLLSNGTCGSTCLNFADQVLMIPGMKLIGSATNGDSAYMEVRDEALPSGLARLTFPQKVWRGMGRGNLEAYYPDIVYDGAWDDRSVRAWVMQIVAGTGQTRADGCDQALVERALGVCRLDAKGIADRKADGGEPGWRSPGADASTRFGVDPFSALPRPR
jgi:hypothetical protein